MEPTQPTSAIRMPRTKPVANPSAAIFVPSGRYGALMFIRGCGENPGDAAEESEEEETCLLPACKLTLHRHQHLVFP